MRPKCPKCSGLLRHDHADTLGPERVTCTICGWFKLRRESVAALNTPDEEPVTPPRPRGTCPSCHRADMALIWNEGQQTCSRCYIRSRNGSDIHAENHCGRRTKNPRGTCPTCKRPNVLLTSTNGDCQRCRKRIEAGHDPRATTRAMPITKATAPVPPAVPKKINLVFAGDNLATINRFGELSRQTSGEITDDICLILDLYLDKKLMMRGAF